VQFTSIIHHTPAFRRIAVVLLAGMLAACASPYQPLGPAGGYTERKLSEGRFEVEYRGNGYTTEALVRNLFMYRCAELTLKNGYDGFGAARLEAPSAMGDGAQSLNVRALADATAGDEQVLEFRSAGGATRIIYLPSAPMRVTTYRMVGTIQMAHRRDVPADMKLYDARALMQLLGPVVQGGGRVPPLTQEALATGALVAGTGGVAPAARGPAGTTLGDLRRLLEQ